ncbi:hypothetical protein WMF30_21035 [Sorangium sp. So ce134]
MFSFHGKVARFSMILTTLAIGCVVTPEDAELSQGDDDAGAETLESTSAELGSRGGYIPPMKGGAMKGGVPYGKGSAPQYGKGYAPQYGKGYAPQYGKGYAPQYGKGYAPQYGKGYAPQYGKGYAPQYGKGYAPQYPSQLTGK